MSIPAQNARLLELLDAVQPHLAHVRPEMRTQAERNYHSTRDYAVGDTVACTAGAAMENCEQIKSCFAPGTPEEAFASLDAVEEEIRRLEDQGAPSPFGKLWIVLILGAIAFFVYFLINFRG